MHMERGVAFARKVVPYCRVDTKQKQILVYHLPAVNDTKLHQTTT